MVNMSSNNNSTPRLTITNGSISQHNHPNTTTTATIPIIRSTIDDFREIAREQSFIISNNSDDVPIKRYPPLPDINNTFFRTETILIPPKQTQTRKQICNHFASTQRGHLPAINKRHNLPTISSFIDVDEDLPQSNTNIAHRAATYTSPGDRIISPIKRPPAPSPPASAQIKRLGQNAFVDDEEEQQDEEHYSGFDDEDSQLYDEDFYRYQQPIIMTNHRIDHYSHNNLRSQTSQRHPTIVIYGERDGFAHPLDSSDFEP